MCAHQEHFDLIDVIESGDVAAVQRMMEQHLNNIEAKLDLGKERTPGDLYAAFAHIRHSSSGR